MSPSDLQAWYGTELGKQVFVRRVKQYTSAEEYALLLKCATGGSRITRCQRAWFKAKCDELRDLLSRFEPIELG